MRKLLPLFIVPLLIVLAAGPGCSKKEEAPEQATSAEKPAEKKSSKSLAGSLIERITQPEEKTEPEAAAEPSTYQVRYPDIRQYLGGEPVVVQSEPLKGDLHTAMERQIMLFKSLMQIGDGGGDSAERQKLQRKLDELRYAFPVPGSGDKYVYEQPSDADSSLNFYRYPVRDYTNARMVEDFRRTAEGAQLDQIEQAIDALNGDLNKWERHMSKVSDRSSNYERYKQLKADNRFLDYMPTYLEEWTSLAKQVAALKQDAPDPAEARRQWAQFEQQELPELNAYIEKCCVNRWPVNANNRTQAAVSRDATLYLCLNVANRQLYFPLQPTWDQGLGMTIAQVGN